MFQYGSCMYTATGDMQCRKDGRRIMPHQFNANAMIIEEFVEGTEDKVKEVPNYKDCEGLKQALNEKWGTYFDRRARKFYNKIEEQNCGRYFTFEKDEKTGWPKVVRESDKPADSWKSDECKNTFSEIKEAMNVRKIIEKQADQLKCNVPASFFRYQDIKQPSQNIQQN